MNTRTGILLLVVLALLIFVVGCASVPMSSQDDLKKVLDGKKVVPGGERAVCEMENPNRLASGDIVGAFKVPCIIGTDPREPGSVYVGTHDEKGYVIIIVVTDKEQMVVWRREGL